MKDMNENSHHFIEISNLIKNFDNGKIKALNGINLEISKGEFISIVGPSGSGKSTLLNMLGALDNPNSGTIRVDGITLNQKEDLSEFRSHKIGFVFQLHNLIPNLSVLENVQIPLIGTGISESNMEKRAIDLLKSVGLHSKLDQKPTKLSGGERQRVAIARALVNNPSIILADEPTGSLDSKTGKLILDLLKNIHQQNDVTLIIVTHEPYVAKMTDRTIKILDGKIKEDKQNIHT
jgi:putative ABC transport system ATP-binding protein